jgi:thiamine biosynthesis protein ThiI
MVDYLIEIFVRYGELGLKSPPVRKNMEKRLAHNISVILEKKRIVQANVQISRKWGRLIVSINPEYQEIKDKSELTERVVKILSENVFGITSVSPVLNTTSDIESISKFALEMAKKVLQPNSSFVVRATRSGNHPYTSVELERTIGEVIYEALHKERNLSVNLTKPDTTISIEVRDEYAFFFEEKIEGYGGLPQGVQGKTLSILRGSKEDAIAGFLLCKRGVVTTPIVFKHKAQQEAKDNSQVLNNHLEKYSSFNPKLRDTHYVVDMNKIMEAVGYEHIQCSTCDKICILISKKIAQTRDLLGITLGNLEHALLERNPEKSSNYNIPIYYPLIALKTKEIIHPFKNQNKNTFCLDTCPGYKNQKKKNVKPPTKEELLEIVANTNFVKVKSD